MRISAKGRYALAAMMQIAAKRDTAEPVSIVSVSEALGVSKLFLEQIAISLKKGGLITAVKGAKGGYQLAREPAAITALDMLRSVENTLFETIRNETLEQAQVVSGALSAMIFAPLDKAIDDCLSIVTLQDLLDYTQTNSDSQSYMLYI